ncbi:hypothetical protein Poly51_10170 [Rubripirellula tenax]|uniref:Uncharacterized protein n=1 Tax=Rubripirellula tenax TaxID=2528015 RepID=A0A5C6FG33_9BACT|nr:hypothetical protein Poly51_10170 [Rubripirellula tenax]
MNVAGIFASGPVGRDSTQDLVLALKAYNVTELFAVAK